MDVKLKLMEIWNTKNWAKIKKISYISKLCNNEIGFKNQ